MPRIYPQKFYLTSQLVKDSNLLSHNRHFNQLDFEFHFPISLEVAKSSRFLDFSNRLYQLNHPKLLLYEFETNHNKYHGLFCCLDIADFQNGHITKHEKIDPQKVLNIKRQYHNTSIKVEPIVVAFEEDENIKHLISNVIDSKSDFLTSIDGHQHQVWLIENKISKPLQNYFLHTDHFHLVDGHHRTTAIENLKMQLSKSKHIFCFLIGLEQIELKSFVWNIHTELTENECGQIRRILNHLHPVKTQHRTPPCPLFPLIFYWKNSYYKFYKNAINDSIIPRFIEEIFYKPIPSSSSWTRKYIPYTKESISETKSIDCSMFFLMQSLTKAQLIDIVTKGDLLPQKSTYALPKLTQNLVLSPF
ncbi:MAG: DUF1015 family protein [Flavobacteriaceae bacterium]|nr:DUF1015 family protein [Flavobacteriaceae bacterium]